MAILFSLVKLIKCIDFLEFIAYIADIACICFAYTLMGLTDIIKDFYICISVKL